MSKYQTLPVISKEDVEAELNLVEGEELCLLLLAMSELENWEWVQDIYLKYILDKNRWVASAAITGLGHLARISGKLDKEKVINCLSDLAKVNTDLEGKIRDTLSDIEIFIKEA